MPPHFFGPCENPLFGVYCPARQITAVPRAVLICPPIAHEHVRAQRAVREVCQNLSRQGFHAMHFDYTGIGDSSRWIGGVMSLETWIDDVRLAAEDLMSRSGCSQVSIVGIRMGAAIAALAVQRDLAADHLLFWEPIISGADHLHKMRSLHRQMTEAWDCPPEADDNSDGSEILGFYYQQAMLEQIASIDLTESSPKCHALTVIDSHDGSEKINLQTAGGDRAQWLAAQEAPDWYRLEKMDTEWLPSEATAKISQALGQPTCSVRVLCDVAAVSSNPQVPF